MISFLIYEYGFVLAVRLRNAARQFWDFASYEWVNTQSDNTRWEYAESPNGDGTSLYVIDIYVPPGGPFIQEAFVVETGEVIACDTTALDSSISEIVTPPTVQEIREEMDTNSTKLANLDVAVSSRSTYAGGPVTSVLGNVGGNVVGSVGSVSSPVTVGTNQDKSGYGLSTASILAIWNQATAAAGILVNTMGAKLRDLVLGSDNRVKISTDAQDLSANLKVNAKVVEDKANYGLTSDYDAAKTAASQSSVNAIPTNPLRTNDARLNNLDAPVSGIPTTPLLASNYTAPDNASIAAILTALQSATFGLARLDEEIDSIITTISGLATSTDMQTVLTRLSAARALLLDNLQYLTEQPGLSAEQVTMLTEARDEARMARKLQANKAIIAPDGLTVTIYDDDGVTPLWVFDVPDNKHRIPA